MTTVPWTRNDKLAAAGLTVAIVSAITALLFPEIRVKLGLEKPPIVQIVPTQGPIPRKEISTASEKSQPITRRPTVSLDSDISGQSGAQPPHDYLGPNSSVEPPIAPASRQFHPNWAQSVTADANSVTISIAPCIVVHPGRRPSALLGHPSQQDHKLLTLVVFQSVPLMSGPSNNSALPRTNDLDCFFRITNETEEQVRVLLNRTGKLRAIDDQGNVYLTQHIELSGQSGPSVDPILPARVPIQGLIVFENYSGDAIRLVEFGIHADPYTPKSPSASAQSQFTVNVRNIPIERRTP